VPTISIPPVPKVSIPPVPTVSIPPVPKVSIPPVPTVSIPPIGGFHKRSVEIESKREGTIKVTSVDQSLDGYLSAPNEEGLYGFTRDLSAAVKFSYNPGDSAAPFVITGQSTESEVSVPTFLRRPFPHCMFQGASYELVGGVQDPHTGCFLVGNVPSSELYPLSSVMLQPTIPATDKMSYAQSQQNPLSNVLGLASSRVVSSIWSINGDALSAIVGSGRECFAHHRAPSHSHPFHPPSQPLPYLTRTLLDSSPSTRASNALVRTWYVVRSIILGVKCTDARFRLLPSFRFESLGVCLPSPVALLLMNKRTRKMQFCQ
jgi:hypothetical protein